MARNKTEIQVLFYYKLWWYWWLWKKTFWFRGRGTLTRLPCCPGQWIVVIKLYIQLTLHFETHLGGGVKGVQGWVPPTGLRGVWVGLARGPWGWDGGPRPGPGRWNFKPLVLEPSLSGNTFLHDAHSLTLIWGRGCCVRGCGGAGVYLITWLCHTLFTFHIYHFAGL